MVLTRLQSKAKQNATNKQLNIITTLYQQHSQDFINFMRYLSWMLYMNNMLSSDRYIAQDIIDLDIKNHWTDEVTIDAEDACVWFYDSQYVPLQDKKTKQEIDIILQKYISDRERLFQLLYKKYVNNQHIVNNETNIFVL